MNIIIKEDASLSGRCIVMRGFCRPLRHLWRSKVTHMCEHYHKGRCVNVRTRSIVMRGLLDSYVTCRGQRSPICVNIIIKEDASMSGRCCIVMRGFYRLLRHLWGSKVTHMCRVTAPHTSLILESGVWPGEGIRIYVHK